MKKLFFFFFFFLLYHVVILNLFIKNDKNLINPLYEKTKVITSGTDLSFMNSYLPMFFGKNKRRSF